MHPFRVHSSHSICAMCMLCLFCYENRENMNIRLCYTPSACMCIFIENVDVRSLATALADAHRNERKRKQWKWRRRFERWAHYVCVINSSHASFVHRFSAPPRKWDKHTIEHLVFGTPPFLENIKRSSHPVITLFIRALRGSERWRWFGASNEMQRGKCNYRKFTI